MNKPLHKNNIQTIPFITTMDWQLSNLFNDGLVLTEHSGSPIALEYLQYSTSSISINHGCSIALEQQTSDKVLQRKGQKANGTFYPDEAEQNPDGTFKRVVYSQIKTTFYNNYRDPTKIWGLENIDFEKSQTKRFLSDKFQLYDIPVDVFGEKIVENSVAIRNTSQDNDYVITDDGNNNLVAKPNLFAKQQEVGYFVNEFVDATNTVCNEYFTYAAPTAPVLSGEQLDYSASLSWTPSGGVVEQYVLQRAVNTGSFSTLALLDPGVTSYYDFPLVEGPIYYYRIYGTNDFGNGAYSNTASVTLIFFESVGPITASFSFDTSSYAVAPGTASLTWPSGSRYSCSLWVERTTDATYPSFSVVSSLPSSSTSYTDYTVMFGNTYIYRVETTSSVSRSYSNEVTVSYEGTIESFDYYTIGQSSSLNSGSGWAGRWKFDAPIRIIASESFDEYSIGQSGSFTDGDGWMGNWMITGGMSSFEATESFDEYTLGQSSSLSGGIGWNTEWHITSSYNMYLGFESFEYYTIGQTGSFDSGSMWLDNSWTVI